MGRKRLELTGQRFTRWTVVRFNGKNKYGQIMWLCRCNCNSKTHVVGGNSLRRGDSKSCGCLKSEKAMLQKGDNNSRYKLGDYQGENTKAQLKFRESIRRRDGYRCQDCGKTQDEELIDEGRKLPVHHINGDHFDNRDENAVTLCNVCHVPYTKKQQQEKLEQEWIDAAYHVQYPDEL